MTTTRQDHADRPVGRTLGRVVTRQTACQSAYRVVGRALARQIGAPGRSVTHITRHHPLRLATILLLATTITACGWQLRGSYNLSPEITPIAVEGGGVADELRNSLRNSNALAESTADSAAADLEILEESDSRRVISVDENGKVDEYEVRYEVRWQLTAKGSDDKSRRILIAPNTFRANRSYDYSANTVLSTNEQEERLIENMREDIAQRILFRLQGVQVADNG